MTVYMTLVTVGVTLGMVAIIGLLAGLAIEARRSRGHGTE